jgi:hypothetical protein
MCAAVYTADYLGAWDVHDLSTWQFGKVNPECDSCGAAGKFVTHEMDKVEVTMVDDMAEEEGADDAGADPEEEDADDEAVDAAEEDDEDEDEEDDEEDDEEGGQAVVSSPASSVSASDLPLPSRAIFSGLGVRALGVR